MCHGYTLLQTHAADSTADSTAHSAAPSAAHSCCQLLLHTDDGCEWHLHASQE